MRRQPLSGSDSEGHTSLSTLARLTTREPVERQPRSRPLLDHFLSLLSTLAIPLQLSSLALAMPTLLLTVLEALLETRLLEAENEWRGSADNQDKRCLFAVLLEAITQVRKVLTRRTGERQGGWMWRAGKVNVDKAINGDEEEIARIAEALLYIADALGVAEGRDGPSTSARSSSAKNDGQLAPRLDSSPRPAPLPSDTADVFHDSRYGITSTSLFAPRPLGSRPLVISSSANPRRPVSSTHDPTVAPLSPSSHRSCHQETIPSTPLHRDSPSFRSPTSAASFLATLSDPSSHLVDKWRENRPVPPLSPRKTGSASAEVLASKSVKEALKRREDARRAPEVKIQSVERGEPDDEAQSTIAQNEVEPDSDAGEQPTRPPASPRPRSSRPPKSRTSFSSQTEHESSSPSFPPCTCSTSPPRPSRRASQPSPPRAQRLGIPASFSVRRIRVTRFPPRAPPVADSDEAAFLSVHSSTDVERSPRASRSTLSLGPSDVPDPAKPLASLPEPAPPDSRAPDNPPSPPPYTTALLAKRDALKAKLAVLERREVDRRRLLGEE